MRSVQLKIGGMSCGHCVARVTKTLGELQGVQLGTVRIGAAELRFDPAQRSLEDILEALRDVGYDPAPA